MTATVQFPPSHVRFSALKAMGRSPAHFRSAVLEPREPSAAMAFGTLVHALLLGGARVRVYDGERRGNAWKEWKAANGGDEDSAHHEDRLILTTSKDHARALRVAERIIEHSWVREVLVGEKEKTLEWEWCGRACRGRLDVIGDGWISDLKISHTSHPEWFRSLSHRMSYHAQLAWYREGARQNGLRVDHCYVLAAEPFAPFEPTSFLLSDRALEQGERICRSWMERLLVCEADGSWPGYAQDTVVLDLPEAEPELVGFAEEADAA